MRQRSLEIGIVSIWHVRGITMVARQLAAALESASSRTHVFARWEAERFFNGPPVSHPRVVDCGQDPDPSLIVAWALERRLDAVLFCEVHPNDWKRVFALRTAGVRVFATETLDLLRAEAIPHYGELDGMVHTAFFTAEAFRALHPRLPAVTVPWGIPPAPCASPVAGMRARRRVVHVSGWGGLGNRKNTDGILRAGRRAAPPDATLVVYSQVPLDRYGTALTNAVRGDPSIEIHEGTVPSIALAYVGADLVLCPSRREGIGLPLLEALGAGVPVLVSQGRLMTNWIVPGEHGIVCPTTVVRDGMYLPLVSVDDEQLAAALHAAAAAPRALACMAEHVRRDRDVWTWTWQAAVLRAQLGRLIDEPGYAPDPAWSYVPAWRLAFEERRRQAGADGARSP